MRGKGLCMPVKKAIIARYRHGLVRQIDVKWPEPDVPEGARLGHRALGLENYEE